MVYTHVLNCGLAGLHNLLGRALAMQGQFREALINLEAAVNLRPEDPALAEDVGRVRRFVGSGVR